MAEGLLNEATQRPAPALRGRAWRGERCWQRPGWRHWTRTTAGRDVRHGLQVGADGLQTGVPLPPRKLGPDAPSSSTNRNLPLPPSLGKEDLSPSLPPCRAENILGHELSTNKTKKVSDPFQRILLLLPVHCVAPQVLGRSPASTPLQENFKNY